MKFEKSPLTLDQQADLLISRGLVANRQTLIDLLSVINYYRLSTYLYPFRTTEDKFKENTTLECVLQRYDFDRQLRLLAMDAIERIEVSIRTKLVYLFCHKYGPFAYENSNNFPELSKEKHEKWLDELSEEIDRSSEPFIIHFKNKYGDSHSLPPLWIAVEVMSFGKTLTFFRGVNYKIKQQISSYYNISDKIFDFWLGALNSVRNICAHHGRLFDRVLGYKPKIPHKQKYPDWHTPIEITRERIFSILTIINYLLKIDAPTCLWSNSFKSLITNNKDIAIQELGFPDNWEESPLWKSRLV
jgi:abortive infection bacteriophage resistance protein